MTAGFGQNDAADGEASRIVGAVLSCSASSRNTFSIPRQDIPFTLSTRSPMSSVSAA